MAAYQQYLHDLQLSTYHFQNQCHSKSERKALPISLGSCELTYAKFRFILDIDGKKPKVSFMIAPPAVSDLAQKRHTEIISDYLKEQGVKLI
jgi:hypothetical protein